MLRTVDAARACQSVVAARASSGVTAPSVPGSLCTYVPFTGGVGPDVAERAGVGAPPGVRVPVRQASRVIGSART